MTIDSRCYSGFCDLNSFGVDAVPLTQDKNTIDAARDPLEAGHLKVGLMGRSIRSAAIVLVSQGGKFTLQFVALIAMTRLVSPNDFGVFGVVTAITGFGLLFKDGLSSGIVQRESLTQAQCSGLFWLSMLVGSALALLTCVAAPFLSSFYKLPVLTPLLVAIALANLVAYSGSQHLAVLRRTMRFDALAVIEQLAMFFSVAIGIVCALRGCGVWSLAVQQICYSVFTAIGAWVASAWRPGRYQSNCGLKSLVLYGKDVATSDVATYTMRNVDNLLIGWACGVGPLGFYDRAYTLMMIPLTQLLAPLGGLGNTMLSRLQNDRERYRSYAESIISISCGLGMPVAVYLCVGAHRFIPVVLGQAWLGSVPLMQALAPAAVADAFILGITTILLSRGKSKEFFLYRVSAATLAVLAFFAGVHWGPLGVAVAVALSRVVAVFIVLRLCLSDPQIPVRFTHIRRAATAPLLAAIGAGLIVVQCDKIIGAAGNPVVSLAISAVGYGLLYLVIWALLPQGARTIAQIAAIGFNNKKLGSLQAASNATAATSDPNAELEAGKIEELSSSS